LFGDLNHFGPLQRPGAVAPSIIAAFSSDSGVDQPSAS
jgi:hypothetical protein